MTADPGDLISTLATAASAFCASNLDDILVLLLLFSSATTKGLRWQVVLGQYLGFSMLVSASLLGYLGGQLLPATWIGVLGLLPISLGVSQIIDNLEQADQPCCQSIDASIPSWLERLGLPAGQAVAAVGITIANGGDNVGLYMPLFARCNGLQLTLTLLVFALMVGLWCAIALRLIQAPAMADLINRYGQPAVPVLLIVLGLVILVDSHTLANRNLTVLVISGLAAMVVSLLRQLHQVALVQSRPAPHRGSLPSR
jgi:cadmium resistance protein CadD (predicted permease)